MSVFRKAAQRRIAEDKRRTRPGGSTGPTPTAPAAPAAPTTGSGSKPFSTHRSLTAAAQILDLSTSEQQANYTRRRQSAQGWQDEAWYYVNNIGEILYAFSLVANSLSRVRLYTGHVADPSTPPAPTEGNTHYQNDAIARAAEGQLARLSSAFGGIPGLMRDAGMNLQAVGEVNLVQIPANPYATPPTQESWDMRSTDELQVTTKGTFAIFPTADQDRNQAIALPKGAFAARIWRPDPRYSQESISSMKALLDAAAELLLLNKTFRSLARSRLNAGMLYLPDGLSVSGGTDPEDQGEGGSGSGAPLDPEVDVDGNGFADTDPELDAGAGDFPLPGVVYDAESQIEDDEFEEALIEAMTTPISDEESASAVVPLIVRGPAELGEKIRLIQFERTFDPTIATRADRVLERILQGLDVPKEIVAGLSSLKFATAQVVDAQLFSSHVEPLALLICDSLTNVFLHPALRQLGFPENEIKKYVIWYDATDVVTRPNRAEDAQTGFGNYAVSFASWRRAHNFTDQDAPTSEEVALRMLIDKGNLTPELTEALLAVIAPNTLKAVREATQAASPAPIPPDIADAIAEPSTDPEDPEAPEAPETPEPPLPFT